MDRTDVKVIGEMEDVLVCLSSNDKVCQVIDIMVADIPDAYGLVLSRDWSAKLNRYFSSDWSHLWLPYKGSPTQIKILREPHMKYNVTRLKEKNEPVYFVLGNYFIELEPGITKWKKPTTRQTPSLISFDFHRMMKSTVK